MSCTVVEAVIGGDDDAVESSDDDGDAGSSGPSTAADLSLPVPVLNDEHRRRIFRHFCPMFLFHKLTSAETPQKQQLILHKAVIRISVYTAYINFQFRKVLITFFKKKKLYFLQFVIIFLSFCFFERQRTFLI